MKKNRIEKSYFDRNNIYVGVINKYIEKKSFDIDEPITILTSEKASCGSILFEIINNKAHDLINDTFFEINEVDSKTNRGVFQIVKIDSILKSLGYDEILTYKEIRNIYKNILISSKLYLKHGMCYGNDTNITRSLDKEEWDRLTYANNIKNYKINLKKY